MIVIDTSSLAAIYRRESDAVRYQEIISKADTLLLPASAYVEFSALRRYGKPRVWLDLAIATYGISIAALDAAIARIAVDAGERYGRGTRHPAKLNFGDCLSYAVAKHLGAPLLYKGGDFIHTDIESALAP
jgi:ribonuclease VapC